MILKMSNGRDCYGIVSVRTSTGDIDREYKISSKEMVERLPRQPPPGCTQQEWDSGLVVISGRACDTGEIYIRTDGSLILKYSEELIGGKELLERVVRFKPGQWTGAPPIITVTSEVIDSLEGRPIVSIIDGVLILS